MTDLERMCLQLSNGQTDKALQAVAADAALDAGEDALARFLRMFASDFATENASVHDGWLRFREIVDKVRGE